MRLTPVVLFIAVIAPWTAPGQTYSISTFAGDGLPVLNIPGTDASIYFPTCVAVDKTGNVFFADGESIVMRLDAKTDILTVVAGNGTGGFSGDNGLATSAQLNSPQGIAIDLVGNLYIADDGNGRVRRVSNGVITTVAGTAGFAPGSVALDTAGNLYIADAGDQRIREVTNGVVTIIAGNGTAGFSGDNGPATSAQLNAPSGIAVDSAGNLYIADTGNQRIRKVSNGAITTIAGNGTAGYSGDNSPAVSAQLNGPQGIIVDSEGRLFIADYSNHRVREVLNGVITTVVGTGSQGFNGDNGPAVSANLTYPIGLALDAVGNLYIAGHGEGRIRKVTNGVITTVAGDGTEGFSGDNGPAANAQLSGARGVAVDSAGNVYIADYSNNRIRKVTNGVITTIAGNGTEGFSGDNGPAIFAQLANPYGVAVDAAGSLYIADTYNNRVRKVSNGVISTVAGCGSGGLGDNGPATGAQLSPYGVAVDIAGNLYIADSNNQRIRKVSNGVITTVAGNGTAGYIGDNGPATSAELNSPLGTAVDAAGNLYIADHGNHLIRKVSNGVISTVAGGGRGGLGDNGPATSAQLNSPWGVAVDAAGNLYIADDVNQRLREVTKGVITTVAGGGSVWGDGGPATNAQLNYPSGSAVDTAGNVYIADNNRRIRLLTPNAIPSITPGGIVPVYSPVPVIAPGSWVSLYGTNLAGGTLSWSGNFPTSLGDTTVTIDNQLAYLWFVSPTQINLQVPLDARTGLVSVVVATPSGTATSTVTLAPYGPSFSLLGDGKHVIGEILTAGGYDLVGPSGTFSYYTRPVKSGETLVLYGVGFGPTRRLM